MLDHVYLVDCPRITDLALKALAASKHLIVVNVADCVRYKEMYQKLLLLISKSRGEGLPYKSDGDDRQKF